MKIAICDKCRRKCNYHYELVNDDNGGYANIPYLNCCDSGVTFYDSMKEAIIKVGLE